MKRILRLISLWLWPPKKPECTPAARPKVQALLLGGPMHGKNIEVTEGIQFVVCVTQDDMPMSDRPVIDLSYKEHRYLRSDDPTIYFYIEPKEA